MNIKMAYKTTSAVGNILNETHTTNKYEHTRIFKLTCLEYQKSYIGQIGVIAKNKM
jgi:hypothetical protein